MAKVNTRLKIKLRSKYRIGEDAMQLVKKGLAVAESEAVDAKKKEAGIKKLLKPIAPLAVETQAGMVHRMRDSVLNELLARADAKQQSLRAKEAVKARADEREKARAEEAKKAREQAELNDLERQLRVVEEQEAREREEARARAAEEEARRRGPTPEEIIAGLRAEKAELEAANHALEVRVAELETKVASLTGVLTEEVHRTAHWQKAYAEKSSGSAGGVGMETAALLARVLSDETYEPTTEEALRTAAALRGDRLIVLPSAAKSAEEAVQFRSGRRLLSMLLRLAGAYGDEVILRKKSDSPVFTERELVRCETEATRRNEKLTAMRTFAWKGAEIEMERHLRIGQAQDPTRTLRVYFAYLPEEQRFAIGWCGEHLPTTLHIH